VSCAKVSVILAASTLSVTSKSHSVAKGRHGE